MRAVEDALGNMIPENAHSIRNMMQLNLEIHDHVVDFYHLHALDRVNPVNALRADPKATSELQQMVSPAHPLSSPGHFRDVQNRLKKFVESGQLGIFKNGYWDNPAYRLPPEADLMATPHCLEALDLRRDIAKIHTIFGGKNPHPNGLVGGVPCPINMDGVGATGAINMERLNLASSIIGRCIEFNNNVYIPDVIAIGNFCRTWLHGGGLSSQACPAHCDIPENANDFSTGRLHLPRGAIIDGNLAEVHDVDVRDPEQVQELVDHSWDTYGAPGRSPPPWDGISEAQYVLGPNAKGSRTDIHELDEAAKYSWIKAPRWRGHAMEVGPLAR